MEYRIDKWSSKIDTSTIGAAFAVAGKLQIYVCHDGTLEVYLDGKDIKEALGIDASSTWFDFGEAVLAVEVMPGEETEMRPKDFGKQEEVVEEKGDINSQYFGESPCRSMIAKTFGVPASILDPKNPTFIDEGFIEKEPPLPGDPEFELPF